MLGPEPLARCGVLSVCKSQSADGGTERQPIGEWTQISAHTFSVQQRLCYNTNKLLVLLRGS